ncbi:MAG: hypothetical protein AABX34_02570 [Nanoarchaeota archaeon]
MGKNRINRAILEPQHAYDLSIEGTRNFIANDIVAHSTLKIENFQEKNASLLITKEMMENALFEFKRK